MLLGFFQGQQPSDLLTLSNIILAVGFLASLVTNFIQFKNKRAETIHETDVETIASYERALKRLRDDISSLETSVTVQRARADGLTAELASVKPELVALMAIDVHELLEFAKIRRKLSAQERELEELNILLVEALRKQPKQLKGGGDE